MIEKKVKYLLHPRKTRATLLLALLTLTFIMNEVTATMAYLVDVTLIPEQVEMIIEIINTILAILVAILAILVARLLKKTPFQLGWSVITGATLVFAIFEFYELLLGLRILRIGGIRDILEFLVVALLFIGFLIIYRSYSYYRRLIEEEKEEN